MDEPPPPVAVRRRRTPIGPCASLALRRHCEPHRQSRRCPPPLLLGDVLGGSCCYISGMHATDRVDFGHQLATRCALRLFSVQDQLRSSLLSSDRVQSGTSRMHDNSS